VQGRDTLKLDAMGTRADAEVDVARSGLVGDEDGSRIAAASTPSGIRSSPPGSMQLGSSNKTIEDLGAKSDSEAETIVLPRKDGHSPSKTRKSIKHEDQSEDEEMSDARLGRKSEELGDDTVAPSAIGKGRRSKHGDGTNNPETTYHGNSSGLSSVPTSPVATRSSPFKPVQSDSGSGEEGEIRKFSRQRSSGVDPKQSKENRISSTKNVETTSRKRTRSISPPSRNHRRSVSTQLRSKYTQGLSHKKKKIPAPLQSTEYQSDDSSASGSSNTRSSRLRHLPAPTTGDSAISPAKMAPHKKHVNSSGQTLVARACQSGKLEVVKQRLEERPDDLNEVDFAENTPLHTASIAGFEDIVQFLLEAGCAIDPVNVARDTPLHDAIDNGHLDVVKLLLDAGANPRKANGKGEDPYDLVDDESDVADELRAAILAAKNRSNDRRSSDDDQMHDNTESRLSHSKGSPRQTPPIQSHESMLMSHTSRRNATTRSIKTSDRVLYQPLNLSELRRAAGQNDTNTVVRILDVHNNNLDDPKSLIIAAKAGHHDVINMLFGYGEFNPDPDPIDNQPPESATPILAAIGRENLEVIALFLNQPDFDPTRRVKGETYYEIAKRRAGSVWKEEEILLREAFDKYRKTHKLSPNKPRSPGLRRDGRDVERDSRRPLRREETQPSRSHKRETSSPKAKDSEGSKIHQRNSSASQTKEEKHSSKKGLGRPKTHEASASATISDRETTPLGPPKQKYQPRRSEPDVPVVSENETATKPRRKLVSGKEFRGERDLEKQRRTSIASTISSASVKERREGEIESEKIARKTSPSVSRNLPKISNLNDYDTSEKLLLDKDKTRSLKRDDSKDRLTAIRSESPAKRPRMSETPPRSGLQEVATSYDASGGPQKRRKLEADTKARNKTESLSGSSPDHGTTTSKINLSHEYRAMKVSPGAREKEKSHSPHRRVISPDRSKHRPLVDESNKDSKNTTFSADSSKSDQGIKVAATEEAAARALKAEEEREALKLRGKEDEEARVRRELEGREAREKAELEERLELERIEEARQTRLARELADREEELRCHQEENERKERQRREDAEALAREQERQRILYLEQEKQRREDQERRRAQIQEQQRAERIRIEKEKRIERLAKLPLLLRWLDMETDPRTPQMSSLFRFIEGFRYDTIRPEAFGQPNGREQWMLNTHVALILGEKDLQLSRYTAWERIPLSLAGKQAIWKIENGMYSLRHPNLANLRKQFDEGEPAYKIVEKCKLLFLELDLFFIKVSEFMFVVPNFPHLRGLELVVKYRELQEIPVWPPQPGIWRRDPGVDPGQQFAPRPNYYINGEFVRQGEILRTKTSATSLGERRVPRRGLVQVFPDDPDYISLAKEQGLRLLLPDKPYRRPSSSSNQEHEQMNGQVNGQTNGQLNGMTPPNSDKSKSINGESPYRTLLPDPSSISPDIPNGIHDPTTLSLIA